MEWGSKAAPLPHAAVLAVVVLGPSVLAVGAGGVSAPLAPAAFLLFSIFIR